MKANLSALSTKSAVSVDSAIADVNIVHISQAEFADKLAMDAVLSNELYIVSCEWNEMYGRQAKNLAAGTDANDAATFG